MQHNALTATLPRTPPNTSGWGKNQYLWSISHTEQGHGEAQVAVFKTTPCYRGTKSATVPIIVQRVTKLSALRRTRRPQKPATGLHTEPASSSLPFTHITIRFNIIFLLKTTQKMAMLPTFSSLRFTLLFSV
jgi:hypothetical protein